MKNELAAIRKDGTETRRVANNALHLARAEADRNRANNLQLINTDIGILNSYSVMFLFNLITYTLYPKVISMVLTIHIAI